MQPILFHLPWLGTPIYGYGLMMVLGFLVAVQLTQFLAKRTGQDPDTFVNAGLIALVAGVVGARLSHIFENWPEFSDPAVGIWGNLKAMANLRSGGLTFFGGLLFAFPITLLYGYLKRVPLRLGMDIVAPALMVGLAFGRVGCFLNGCCYGAECNLPWAVHYPYYSNAYIDHVSEGKITPPPDLLARTDTGHEMLIPADEAKHDPVLQKEAAEQHSLWVHPAQLYSVYNALLLAGVLTAFFTLRRVPGQVFALMFMLIGLTRFLLEMLRVEPAVVGRGSGHLEFLPSLSFSMTLCFGLVVLGAIMWYAFGWFERHHGDADSRRALATA